MSPPNPALDPTAGHNDEVLDAIADIDDGHARA